MHASQFKVQVCFSNCASTDNGHIELFRRTFSEKPKSMNKKHVNLRTFKILKFILISNQLPTHILKYLCARIINSTHS